MSTAKAASGAVVSPGAVVRRVVSGRGRPRGPWTAAALVTLAALSAAASRAGPAHGVAVAGPADAAAPSLISLEAATPPRVTSAPTPEVPDLAARQAVTVAVAPEEAPVAWLSVPALNLSSVPVYERGLDARRQMLIGPGFSVTHYAFSSPLGGPSNSVLYGHDDMNGSVFARLSHLREGNRIIVRLPSGSILTYSVSSAPAIVTPDQVGVLTYTPAPQLTLFSCYPLFVDDHRVVVVALPV